MNDRFSEYPLVINALKRFHQYPESVYSSDPLSVDIFLGSLFRIYTGTMDFFGIPTKACWNVNRGDGLNPVESCEGMGDAAYFYVSCVFVLNGVMMSLFFLYGTYLSGSRLGGVITVLCLFFNHGESTRVMWTPPLRESFSYPFFVLQMLLLTRIPRRSNSRGRSLVALGACNVLFLLPWPFAQFVLLTQAHIGNLIRSKFTNYKDFHTLMYTCVAEFDFMELETLLGYVKMLILLVNIVIVAIISGKAIKEVWSSVRRERVDSKEDIDIDTKQTAQFANGEMVYHSLQLVAFAVLAILVMRIKLFLAPLMCIMASLICSRELFGWIGEHFKRHITVFGILSIMAI
ncbi:hypothetical protein J4Q44_G00059060 [Coregonus suidteri]|uniref:Uncharacterized protein n=1 Tax=Coregonus suidteri TaxID=861788 RepID=A0AAN8MB49_9TELE